MMKGVCSLWTLAALACLDNVTHRRLFTERAPRDSLALMKKLALIYALLLAASPAAAQLATSQRVQQLGGESVQSTPIEAPRTGVFCIEEMTATFCNVTTGPEHEWLRVEPRVHIEEWGLIKRRICIERRRWCRQFVDPSLLKRTAVQRIVQLKNFVNGP